MSKIRRALVGRGVRIADRSVTEQLRRYGELIALRAANNTHLEAFLAEQSQVNLALDGLQPDVDQKLLWILRTAHSARSTRAEAA